MRAFPVLPAAALVAAIGVTAENCVAHAETPVVVEGIDDEMRETLRDLLPDREQPEDLFDAERIAEEAAERAHVWLRSEGYYAATVTPEAQDNPIAARIVIAPGRRFTFAAPQVSYGDAPPSTEASNAVADALSSVSAGAPARAHVVLQAEAAAIAALQQAGYADAEAGERRIIVDHASGVVTAQFAFSPQARVRLGDATADPDDVFRHGFVDDLQNWDTGDPYTPEALAQLRRDLSATGAVTRVSTELAPPDENGLRDVVLGFEPARRNAYELGVSYSTTEGVGVQGEWTRRNVSGRADPLTVGVILAELQQSVDVELRRPHAAGRGQTIRYGASAIREHLDAYARQGASVFASVDASRRLRTATTYGASLAFDEYDDLAGGVTEALVLSGFGAVRRDTTEFTLDPRDGSITELRVEPSVSTGDETLGFVRAIAEARGYETFGRADSLTLAARIHAGWLEAVSGSVDDVPPDRRFYAGGGGSVRGYEYNSIYPLERDALGLAPGGQGALEASLEARWRFAERWGAVAFVDGGNAFDDWSDAGDLAFGVGIGIRYNLGFAPLRVDVAAPLNDDRGAEDDYALYVSLGQAF
ncbi:MAG: BamA/TamA family outer membrane protein [Hyphomonadaceae bacterium]|nr:BamA/TamA family outer membrane protein [Hyphomonadaceae bacterium]